MWCPNCLTHHEAGKTRCDACGHELVAELPEKAPSLDWNFKYAGSLTKIWPQDAFGKPEPPALLTHCRDLNMEDKIIVNMLDAYGIPVLRNLSQGGRFGKLILGVSGDGVSIFVPESMLEDARALLEAENEPDPYEGEPDDRL